MFIWGVRAKDRPWMLAGIRLMNLRARALFKKGRGICVLHMFLLVIHLPPKCAAQVICTEVISPRPQAGRALRLALSGTATRFRRGAASDNKAFFQQLPAVLGARMQGAPLLCQGALQRFMAGAHSAGTAIVRGSVLIRPWSSNEGPSMLSR